MVAGVVFGSCASNGSRMGRCSKPRVYVSAIFRASGLSEVNFGPIRQRGAVLHRFASKRAKWRASEKNIWCSCASVALIWLVGGSSGMLAIGVLIRSSNSI
jgi:hypothetical protein